MSEEIRQKDIDDGKSVEDCEEAEFDAYAAAYDEGIDNPIRRCVGGDPESFIEVKADWLLRRCNRLPYFYQGKNIKLLDYGCGTGIMLRVLRRLGFVGGLTGCDVSCEMLEQAKKQWPLDPLPELYPMKDGLAPFDDAKFDLIVVSSVLHHVPVDQRDRTYADIMRLLKPGGHVCVFEHNPYNPLTQWVVRHTPIDKNAVLLRPKEVREGLVKAGASRLETAYIMFLPPRFRSLRFFERYFYWLPFAAQYAVFAL
ncbi:MAG: class I SAM-dependent methyltransferase [Thermoguttaceae bacterium]|jgi:SAM-dependent methyltransferase